MKKALAVAVFLLITSFCANAQWQQTSGVPGKVTCQASDGTNIFAGTPNGVFLSTNNGTNWLAVNSGLANGSSGNYSVQCILIKGTSIYLGTLGGGVFLSTNNGNSWTAVNNGLSTDLNIYSLIAFGSNIFVGTDGVVNSIYTSTNNGTSWTPATTGIPSGRRVNSLSTNSTTIYATAGGDIYKSANNGASWTKIYDHTTVFTQNFHDYSVFCLAVNGSNIYAGTNGNAVSYSNDNGVTWNTLRNGFTADAYGSVYICALTISGNNIYAGTQSGTYVSINNGTSWTFSGLSELKVNSLISYGNNVFAATIAGVFLTINKGATWNYASTGISSGTINSWTIDGTNIYAGASDGGIFISNDNGNSWTATNNGFGYNNGYGIGQITSLTSENGSTIFGGSDGGSYSIYLLNSISASWSQVSTGLNNGIQALATIGSNIFGGTFNGGIYKSNNNGKSWTQVNSGIPYDMVSSTYAKIISFGVSGNNIFTGTDHGAFLSTDNGNSWTPINNGLVPPMGNSYEQLNHFAVSGTNIFASGGSGVYLTTNNGTTWSQVNNGLPPGITALAAYGTNVIAGTNSGVYLTIDSGKNWSAVNTGLTNLNIQSLTSNSTNIFAGVVNGGVWKSRLLGALSVNVTPTNITCFGNCNGSAAAVITGGTPPFNYLWSNGKTTATITGLCTGTFSVTVTDAVASTATASAVITQPAAVSAAVTPTPASTPTACDGSVTASGQGGTPSYTYKWSIGGQTSASVTGLCSGSYVVTITDANGCSGSKSVNIISSTSCAVSATVTASNAACSGSCNGIVSLSSSGGASPYSYTWSGGSATNSTITGLCAGNYTITVTDANGCSTSTSTSITAPAPIICNVTTTNATGGSSNGKAQATWSGGLSPFSYLWSIGGSNATTSGNTSTITGLSTGNYTITITDGGGCTSSCGGTVNSTACSLSPSYTITQSISCNGSCNAIVTATATGGTAPYSYVWPNGTTGTTVSGLCAGTYVPTISDAGGCKATISINLTQPSAVTASVATTPASSGNNGSATAVVNGGTSPYNYIWNTGANVPSITGLTAGTYTVTVSDAHGCGITTATGYVSNCSITLTLNAVHEKCYGDCNGTIKVKASGGSPPYQYSWSNNGTTDSLSNLCANAYSIVVTDANYCNAYATISITQPLLLSISMSHTDTRAGKNNGCANANVTGGTPSYTYKWGNGATVSGMSGLAAGIYKVSVTDANGCSSANSVNILTSNCSVAVTTSLTSQIQCNGGCQGALLAIGSGGTPSYTYAWSNGSSLNSISGLCAGSYKVTVTDQDTCVVTGSYTITQPAVITTTITVSTSSGSNGTATDKATGGTSPYKYKWSTGATTSTASGLAPGKYAVTLTDAHNCTKIDSATIARGTGIAEFDNFSKQIKVYPSPASDRLHIETADLPISLITIYNQLGEKVFEKAEVISELDLSQYSAGIYFINFNSKSGLINRQKFIVAR